MPTAPNPRFFIVGVSPRVSVRDFDKTVEIQNMASHEV